MKLNKVKYINFLITKNKPTQLYNTCNDLVVFLKDTLTDFKILTFEDSITIRELADPVLKWFYVIEPSMDEEDNVYYNQLNKLSEYYESLINILTEIEPEDYPFRVFVENSFIYHGYFNDDFDLTELY